MKLLSFILLLVCIASCRREAAPVLINDEPAWLTAVKKQLSDSLPAAVFRETKFDTAFHSETDEGVFVRFAFHGVDLDRKFILLKISDNGSITEGRIIDVTIGETDYAPSGTISISYLNGSSILQNAVIDHGYIQWPDALRNSKVMVVPGAAGKVLPEVILVSSKLKPPANYYLLSSLSGGGGGAATPGWSGQYSSSKGNGGSASGSATSGQIGTKGSTSPVPGKAETNVKLADVIVVDFEFPESVPAIDVAKYLKCFDGVPDAGALCSITIFADIPVDSDPNKLFDIHTDSPGHCFIQLKKQSGNSSVLQNIGFYPETNYKSILTYAPVPGKFVDNGSHEMNASMKMDLTITEFKSVLNNILYLSRFVKYDIDGYNCTDFALEVFNTTRSLKLEAIKVDIPGAQATSGTNTPQGLYLKFKEMKANKHAESSNIITDLLKGFVANSKGACN